MDFCIDLAAKNYSYPYSYKKKISESNPNIETLQEDIEKLKKPVKRLAKYSGDLTPKSAVKKQLESLAKMYNTYKKSTGKITDDETKEQIEKLEKLFSDNEAALKKLGLKKSDKKMELDSDIFDKADKKIINKIFEGRDSFAKKADKIIKKMEECAGNAQYKIREYNIGATMQYSSDDVDMALFFGLRNENANELAGLSESMKSGENNMNLAKDKLVKFAEYSNSNYYDNEYHDKLKTLLTANKNELSKIGIIVKDTDGEKTIEYDENISNFDSKAFIKLFGQNAEFVKSFKEYCTIGIEQALKTKKVGVSLDIYA